MKWLGRASDLEHALELVKHDADYMVRGNLGVRPAARPSGRANSGASELEADAATDEVRKCDAERFALETSGGPFSRRALIRRKTERSRSGWL